MPQIIKKNSLLVICLFAFFQGNAQIDYSKLCKQVLLFNKKDKEYHFKSNTEDSETFIKFYGSFKTKSNKVYKAISIKNIWGPNSHTNGYIWIYNTKNQYVGRYVLGDAYDLPVKLKNNSFHFTGLGSVSDNSINKKVNFGMGIPYSLKVPASNGFLSGIYPFSE
jgi:hypothetical protein